MRKLLCQCTISHVGKADGWQEYLDVYLEDIAGDPKQATPEQINSNARQELEDIITDFNAGEESKARHGIEPRPRELKNFVIMQNRKF